MHIFLVRIEGHASDKIQVGLLEGAVVHFQVRGAKEIILTQMQRLAGKQISGKLF